MAIIVEKNETSSFSTYPRRKSVEIEVVTVDVTGNGVFNIAQALADEQISLIGFWGSSAVASGTLTFAVFSQNGTVVANTILPAAGGARSVLPRALRGICTSETVKLLRINVTGGGTGSLTFQFQRIKTPKDAV